MDYGHVWFSRFVDYINSFVMKFRLLHEANRLTNLGILQRLLLSHHCCHYYDRRNWKVRPSKAVIVGHFFKDVLLYAAIRIQKGRSNFFRHIPYSGNVMVKQRHTHIRTVQDGFCYILYIGIYMSVRSSSGPRRHIHSNSSGSSSNSANSAKQNK